MGATSRFGLRGVTTRKHVKRSPRLRPECRGGSRVLVPYAKALAAGDSNCEATSDDDGTSMSDHGHVYERRQVTNESLATHGNSGLHAPTVNAFCCGGPTSRYVFATANEIE